MNRLQNWLKTIYGGDSTLMELKWSSQKAEGKINAFIVLNCIQIFSTVADFSRLVCPTPHLGRKLG